MLTNPQPPQIHLPKGWQDCVKSAVLHAIALAHYAIVYARALAADSINARVRLAAENDRLHEACALVHEELRITQIAPQRRPHYGPHERMAILELRAARGWPLKQTADTFGSFEYLHHTGSRAALLGPGGLPNVLQPSLAYTALSAATRRLK